MAFFLCRNRVRRGRRGFVAFFAGLWYDQSYDTNRKEGARMQLGTFRIENPIVLAPMAGVTDWAYRYIAASLGADITVTEMVSSRA